jgi:hypothetical protein
LEAEEVGALEKPWINHPSSPWCPGLFTAKAAAGDDPELEVVEAAALEEMPLLLVYCLRGRRTPGGRTMLITAESPTK